MASSPARPRLYWVSGSVGPDCWSPSGNGSGHCPLLADRLQPTVPVSPRIATSESNPWQRRKPRMSREALDRVEEGPVAGAASACDRRPCGPDAAAHPGATWDVAAAQPDYGCCGIPTLPAGAMLAGTGTLQGPQLIEDIGLVSEHGETGGHRTGDRHVRQPWRQERPDGRRSRPADAAPQRRRQLQELP